MRPAALLMALAVLLTACGDSSPPLAEASTDRLELAAVPEPQPLVTGEPATIELEVTNVSDEPALLTFDTTQRGDVALSTDGTEVYRWSERRMFAQQRDEVALVPGQRVRFPLDVAELPVAPGEYEMLATVTGLPKLRTIRTSVTVSDVARSATPSPEATARPTPPVAAERLPSAVEVTTGELALPLASALTGDAFDSDGAVLRQEMADAFARLTFAELLLAYRVATDDDVAAVRPLAVEAAGRAAETLGGLRSVGPADREAATRLLHEHVVAVEDYAAAVGVGGDDRALEVPRAELEEVTAGLGPVVAVTAGGVIDTDAATDLFGAWTDALLDAVRTGLRSDAPVEQAHRAATEAVEPLALDVAGAYVAYLDLDGFESTAATVRQELATQLVDEVLLLAIAVGVGPFERSQVADVLDGNAGELAAALGRAPAIDASEEAALRERWRARDAALLDAAATRGGEAPDALARADDQIARLVADATDTLEAGEVRRWLEAQRTALLDALDALGARP